MRDGQKFQFKNGSLVDLTDTQKWFEIHPPAMLFEKLESFLSINLTASFKEGGNEDDSKVKVSHC